jgi:1-acyl-sn-glycerol-3-phosphate acyltransferase
VGTLLVFAVAWVPVRVAGARVAAWLTTHIARLGLWVFNIHLHCGAPQHLRQHRGLIFPNHLSYFDIIVLQSIFPLRWLSKDAIRSWPFVGWVAVAIDTVFVNREDKASRTAARQQLARAICTAPHPPLVLFPEGGISPDRQLQPFRYGAFEIALDENIAFLPCAIVYEQPEIIHWGDETLLAALWRVACHARPLRAEIVPLPTIQPQPGDAAPALAAATHQTLLAALHPV